MQPREADAVFVFLRRVVMNVALVIASPFLMLAFLFFLLQKPLLWVLIPLSIAALLLATAAVVWLVVRSKLRALQARIDWAAGTDIPRAR